MRRPPPAPIVRLTFGKMGDHRYCLDFAHPFSVAQALGVALASFDAP